VVTKGQVTGVDDRILAAFSNQGLRRLLFWPGDWLISEELPMWFYCLIIPCNIRNWVKPIALRAYWTACISRRSGDMQFFCAIISLHTGRMARCDIMFSDRAMRCSLNMVTGWAVIVRYWFPLTYAKWFAFLEFTRYLIISSYNIYSPSKAILSSLFG